VSRIERFMVWCTIAIVATLIGCCWWIHKSIEDNASWILRDLEQLQR
jgi:hypothetical protein